jgi:hypothetical protein
MNTKDKKQRLPDRNAGKEKNDILNGYPLYPPSEDVYSKSHKEKNIDPEDVSKEKSSKNKANVGKNNEKDFKEDVSGSDLDVPGSELDDLLEDIGDEDEENNFYSLGGDDHEELDEDKGD